MKRAVFLDRDGTLNANVLNAATGAFESPHRLEDLQLLPGAVDLLKQLSAAGYALFLVSNQPSFAKGKTSLATLQAIAACFEETMKTGGVTFTEYFYCFHHPEGIEPDYSGPCMCRKPSPYFLQKAARDHDLDLTVSWMIGDRSSDISCGQAAGTGTIFIKTAQGQPTPADVDYLADNLADAVAFITR